MDAGAGDDTVRLSSTGGAAGSVLTGIDGEVTLAGGAGTDSVVLDASGSLADLAGVVRATTVTGFGMPGTVTYGTAEALSVLLGSGDDTVLVASTSVATLVDGGAGDDAFTVNETPDTPATPNALAGRLHLEGGLGADTTTVHLWGNGTSRIDVTDADLAHLLTINGTGLADVLLLRATAALGLVASLTAAVAGAWTAAEWVTYAADITGVALNTLGGTTWSPSTARPRARTADLGAGNDLTRIGQVFTDYVANVEFGAGATFESTRGWLSDGVHRAATINGNDGNDIFEVYRNQAAIALNGNDGDDIFVVRTFVDKDSLAAINTGAGSDQITYSLNSPVDIDGGGGKDLVVIVGDESNNLFVITADGIWGSGIQVSYANIEKLVVYGMQGDDRIYVLSTSAEVAVSVFGGLGSDRIQVGGSAPDVTVRAADGTTTTVSFATTTLAAVQGALVVAGGNDPDPDYDIEIDTYLPVLLPGESSGHPHPVTATTGAAIETGQVDTVVFDDRARTAGASGTLDSDTLTGFGMLDSGVTYLDAEAVQLLLGSGADTLTVESTHSGTTEVDAGGGDDRVVVRTIDGHTRIAGAAGDDTIVVGSADGLLDLLAATLLLDGGAGDDTVTLDDSGDTNANLGWLTGTTLTGLDMVARAALDALGRSLDLLYAVNPAAASFTLGLARLVGGVSSALGSIVVAAGTSAADLAAALQALIFPDATSCGLGGETVCAASVYVWQVGTGYLIGFRGEANADPAHPVQYVLTATGATSAIDGLLRTDGITYTGVETLDLALGTGDDVLNVRGTTATTNVDLGAGDDRVYVSSIADVRLDGHPDALGGVLDDLRGTINLQLGAGHHTLLVSDQASTAGDEDVLVTDRITAARDRDAAVADWAEIAMLGLAAGAISYAADGGDFSGGIRVWLGAGDDHLRLDGAFRRDGVRTTTWLSTGLGDDTVVATLTDGEDGFVVLHLQGPDRSLPTASDDDTLDASGSTLPLVVFGGQGDDRITTGSGRDVVVGDHGLVLWFAVDAVPVLTGLADGVLSASEYAALAAVAAGVAGWGGPGDFSTNTETLVGLVLAVTPAVAGDDTVAAGAGDDIIIGGTGADDLSGDAGDDVVVGDLGYVAQTLSFDELLQRRVSAWGDTLGGNDVLRGGDGADLLVGGQGDDRVDGGAGTDLLFGDSARVDQAWTRTATGWNPSFLRITLLDHDVLALKAAVKAFGDDDLAGGAGSDVVFGQLGDDVIQGDGSIDLAVGASRDAQGRLVLSPSELAPTDGDDYIEGGGGNDVIFGNGGSDDIIGGSSALFSLVTVDDRPDGRDILFGGAGTQAGRNDDTVTTGDSDVLVGDNGYVLRLTPVAAILAGLTGVPSVAAGALGATVLRVVVLLDYTDGGPDARTWLFPRITATQLATSGTGLLDVWGADELHGEAGDDALYGGGGNDVLYGDAGNDHLVGGWGHDWLSGGTGDDLLFGDEAWAPNSDINASQPKKVRYSNDVIFGGWDDDIVDGGWGDDLVSGAEALADSWALDSSGRVVESSWNRPFNDGTLLTRVIIASVTRKTKAFAKLLKAWNGRLPLCADGTLSTTCASPLVWFGSTDITDGRPGSYGVDTDGADLVMGGAGRDWVIGGTGQDALWGGRDNDVLASVDDPALARAATATRVNPDYSDMVVGGYGWDTYIKHSAAVDPRWRANGTSFAWSWTPLGSFRGEPITVRVPKILAGMLARVSLESGPLVARVLSAGQAWLSKVSSKSLSSYLKPVVVNGVRVVPLENNFRPTPDPADFARWAGALWRAVAPVDAPALVLVGTVGPLSPLSPLSGLRAGCPAGTALAAGGACLPLVSQVDDIAGVCSLGEDGPNAGCRSGVGGLWWLWRDPTAGTDAFTDARSLPECSVGGGDGSGPVRCVVRDNRRFTAGIWPV
ncbi:MAG: calcium-binding protein [Propionicimonas sp.]